MRVVALFAVFVGVAYSQLIEIPAGAIQGVRNAGIQTISDKVKVYNDRLTNAVEAFKPINATCNTLLNTAIAKCTTCVKSKCEARAKQVCKPEKWQEILGKTIGFFKDGVPNFFTKSIPNLFVDKIGGGIVDVGKDIGNFFTDTIGGGLEDFGKTIGSGVVDIGKGAIDGIVDFGNTIGNGVVDVGKKIGDGVSKAIDGIKDIGSKIGDFGKSIGKAFGGLFGKRETYALTRRATAPSCSDFENNPNNACNYYLQADQCKDCGFDSNKVCPGYKAATAEITAANNQRKWMTGIKKQNYDITKLRFNPTAIAGNGGFRNVVVNVNLFGKDLQFTLDQAINPYLPQTAGPIIATRAIEEFRKSA